MRFCQSTAAHRINFVPFISLVHDEYAQLRTRASSQAVSSNRWLAFDSDGGDAAAPLSYRIRI